MRTIVIAVIAGALLAPAAGAAAPTLKVVTRAPLVVTGAHFRAAERVTVRVGGTSLVIRTTPLGTFKADLGNLGSDRCSVSLVVVSAHAERVVLPLRPRAMCTPLAPASPTAGVGAAP